MSIRIWLYVCFMSVYEAQGVVLWINSSLSASLGVTQDRAIGKKTGCLREAIRPDFHTVLKLLGKTRGEQET